MVKDRLEELIQKSDPKKMKSDDEDDSESVRLYIGPDIDALGQIQAEVDAVRRDLDLIDRSHKLLIRKQKDVSSAGNSEERIKYELTEITDTINKTARCVNRKIKAMGLQVEQDGAKGTSSTKEGRIRKIQHMSLTEKFSNTMQGFLESQEEYRDKCRDMMSRQIRIVNPAFTEEVIEKCLEDDDYSNAFIGNVLVEEQKAKQDLDDAKALLRHLKKIEQGIVEVHELFQDLSSIVSLQGESITRIEDFVHDVQVDVEQSTKQLKGAKQKQTRARKTKFICIAVVVTAVIIAIAVVIGVNV